VALRFHFRSASGEVTRGVRAWTVLAGSARGDPRDSLRPAGSGLLGPKTFGDAAIPVTFPHPGTYRYYVQVEDEAGRWSNVLSAAIVINPRILHVPHTCP
jgi:hypothetical protein